MLRLTLSFPIAAMFMFGSLPGAAATFAGLGDLVGGVVSSHAAGVSAEGTTVVGQSVSDSGGEAFRWTSSEGMVGLGDLAGPSFGSSATAVSGDGSVVVGHGSSGGNEFFRWTQVGGMVSLQNGSFITSTATAVSEDGSVVVGLGIGGASIFDQWLMWTQECPPTA